MSDNFTCRGESVATHWANLFSKLNLKPQCAYADCAVLIRLLKFTCSLVLITSKGHVTIAPAVPPTLEKHYAILEMVYRILSKFNIYNYTPLSLSKNEDN